VNEGVERRLTAVSALVRDRMAPHLGDPHGSELAPLMRSYPDRGGKGIRPALLIATCEAFGGSEEDALAVAVSAELLHNAFLVHDDVEDDSDRRRGLPSLHREVGLPRAVNTGDALAVAALRPIHEDTAMSSTLRKAVVEEWMRMASTTVSGQATELSWRTTPTISLTPDDYLDLILRKTCWYTTIFPLRVGAMIATRDQVELDELTRFGFLLGAAFQIRDDLLDLVAEPGTYGKDLHGDLWEGKRTLMLIHLAGEVKGDEASRLDEYLAKDRRARTDDEIAMVHRMMLDHGSVHFAQEFGLGIARAAADAFDGAFRSSWPGSSRDFVRDLVPYMLTRAA
jgi:geranylgeranyl diphosphate synthase type II